MRKTFKNFTIITCMVTLALSFGGCGKNQKVSNAEVKTVEIWSIDSHSKSVMNEIVTNYNNTIGKENGITINYIVKEGNFSQIMELAFASLQAPQLFSYVSLGKYSESGDIAALEDMPGGMEVIEKYKKYLRKTYNIYNGKTYCVPMSASTFGMVYNKEMFKAAGIVDENGEPTPPKTYSEVREYAKRLTNTSKGEYGIILPLKWSGFFNTEVRCSIMGSTGHIGYDPVKGVYDWSGLKPAIEMVMGIKEDRSFFPGAEGIDNDPARAQFAAGKIGMKFAGSFDVGVYNDQFPATIDWGVAPYPYADVNNKYRHLMSVNSGFCISNRIDEKTGNQAVMEVYKWLHGDELARKLYIAGMQIPYDWNIVGDIELKDSKKGWKEFCQLTTISNMDPLEAPVDMTGEKTLKDIFLNEIWTEKKSIDEAISNYNEIYARAMEKKFNDNKKLVKEDYIDKSWDVRLK